MDKIIVLTSLRPSWKLSYSLPPTPCCMGTSGDTVSIAVFMLGYLQVNYVPCAQSLGPQMKG